MLGWIFNKLMLHTIRMYKYLIYKNIVYGKSPRQDNVTVCYGKTVHNTRPW